ncbi:MAG: hypothetical protein NC337_02555 [Roseburia sp.]|nr:hypothetical protein [Roseburia sp.]
MKLFSKGAFSLYRVELRRLLLSKAVWCVSLFCLLAPLLGYLLPFFSDSRTMSGRYIANPVLAGTVVGALLWAGLTIAEADRLHRSGVSVLADAIISPVRLSAARAFALLTIAALVTALTALACLPYTVIKMDYLFAGSFYIANFLILMLPTWWISILFADAFYGITRRVELSVMLYAGLVCVNIGSILFYDYFMRWLSPRIISYSDGFSSIWPLRVVFYTRLLWVCFAGGVWLVSTLCVRRYQRGLLFSLARGLRRIGVLLPALLLIAAGIALWRFQPFIDHGPKEYVFDNDAEEDETDIGVIRTIRYSIRTQPALGLLYARAEYDIQRPCQGKDKLALSPGYKITRMTYGGSEVAFETAADDLNGWRSTYFELPQEWDKTLVIEYEGFPTISRATALYRADDCIDPNYISLSPASLFPQLNNYYSPQGTASVALTIPAHLTPLLNYAPMTESVDNGDGTRTWNAPCSKYVMNFTAGDYVIETIPVDDLNIDFVYGKAYQSVVEKSDVCKAVADVFTYCGEHYGRLPWAQDNRLLLQQRSSMVMGGYALPGVSQWFETVLSPDTLSDPNKGASATEVFIHEMVHQWWGGLGLSCQEDELWSDEGLTVYATYRIVKKTYGELYAQQYYVDVWREAVELQNRSFYNRHPEYVSLLPDLYQAELRMSNSGVNHYNRMPLMILKAQELVGGEEAMDAILRQMYADRELFDQNHFSYQDFLRYCGLTKEALRLE